MPPRRRKRNFNNLQSLNGGGLLVFEKGLPYRALAARLQRISYTVMLVVLQWTEKYRKIPKTGSRRCSVASENDYQCLPRIVVNGRTASSWQLASRCSTATGLLMWASSNSGSLLLRGLRGRVPF